MGELELPSSLTISDLSLTYPPKISIFYYGFPLLNFKKKVRMGFCQVDDCIIDVF